MSFQRQRAGELGEEAAAQYLLEHGYEILERNFDVGEGELDIVARQKDTLIFVEVKSFDHAKWAEGPSVNLTKRKQRQIIRAAKSYLARFEKQDFYCRFDFIAVWPDSDKPIEHFAGAFMEG